MVVGWGGGGNEGISISIKGPRGEEGPARLYSHSAVTAQAYLVRPRSLAHSGGAGPATNTNTLEY